MKKILLVLAILFAIPAAILGFKAYQFHLQPMVADATDTVTIDVAPGSTFQDLPEIFRKEGLELNLTGLKIWLRIYALGRKLRVGEYEVRKNWSQGTALSRILSGQPLRHKFIVKEGFNIYDIARELEKVRGPQAAEEFFKLVRDPQLQQGLPLPKVLPREYRSLEGFLFPETYSYSKYESTRSLVIAMVQQFKNRALPLLQTHPWAGTEEGLFKLLTLASIVEKESGNQEEQPVVASVFWNRLEKKMKLQSDPTTIYALFPNFDGNLRKADLLRSTPYNTYTIASLPVGPISNPGETALRAILKPAQTPYFYFVSRGDGSHEFSADYSAHDRAVKKYQLKRKSGN